MNSRLNSVIPILYCLIPITQNELCSNCKTRKNLNERINQYLNEVIVKIYLHRFSGPVGRLIHWTESRIDIQFLI